jgi:hypothetical protein
VNIPRSWGSSVSVLRQTDHAGKVADEFDFEAALCGRPQDHLIDQRADDFYGLGARGLLLQEGLQRRDLSPIGGGEIGMKPHRLVLDSGPFFRDLTLALFKGFQLRLNSRTS